MEILKDLIINYKKIIWKEEFWDLVTWEEFDNKFYWCNRCESYNEGICICYAR